MTDYVEGHVVVYYIATNFGCKFVSGFTLHHCKGNSSSRQQVLYFFYEDLERKKFERKKVDNFVPDFLFFIFYFLNQTHNIMLFLYFLFLYFLFFIFIFFWL